MSKFTPLIPDVRLLEIIRAFTGDDPTIMNWEQAQTYRKDMNDENNLLVLCRLIADEAQARLPLWELEKSKGGV